MSKISLLEFLRQGGALKTSAKVSSVLLPQLEVYGFVNSVGDDNLFASTWRGLQPNGVVNKAAYRQIVCSKYLYQILECPDGDKTAMRSSVSPIFYSVTKCLETTVVDVAELYIPSLVNDKLYRDIKARIGTGMKVSEQTLRRSSFPDYIKSVEDKAVAEIAPGTFVCNDYFGNPKSVGEEIMAVCRYLHPETGTMCYAQYGLDELYMESEHE